MKNKMVSDKQREDYKKGSGQSFPENKCSGRTIGYALMAIATAMREPGKWVEIWDHDVPEGCCKPTISLRRNNLENCRSLLDQMHLKFFKYRSEGKYPAIKYDVFGD